MKTPRVGRVIRLLTTLQSGRDYSADDLSRIFKTSRRTIFRDLKELAGVGVPYKYSPQTGGYAVDPEFFLPPINLSIREALGLLLLAHRLRANIQAPFKESVLLAALKIENNLPAGVRRYCNSALRTISARPPAQAHSDLLDNRFAGIQDAILNKRKLLLQYDSLFDGRCMAVELCPYHLLYNQRAWYVLGYSSTYRSIRTFKLSRIKDLRLLSGEFTNGGDFDPIEYLGRAWSMIPEGKMYSVNLRFLPKVANNVVDVQWHSTQKVARCEDGSAIVEFRVDGLGEISWWVLGYGDQVQVLAPAELRTRIVKAAENIIRLNAPGHTPVDKL